MGPYEILILPDRLDPSWVIYRIDNPLFPKRMSVTIFTPDQVSLCVDGPEKSLPLWGHLFDQFIGGIPLVPFAVDRVVAAENRDAIAILVLPRGTAVREGLGEEKQGTCRT